jgi:CBS domain containing-hemolysin-like protein
MAVSAASLLATLILISLSALFSGLTLGLMGLDKVGLQIVIESGLRPEVPALCARMCSGYHHRAPSLRKKSLSLVVSPLLPVVP